MRSIGVFRGSAQSLASDTASHNNSSEMDRRLARQNVKTNSKPKVGVLSSSQVTQMRAVTPTTQTLGKVNFGGAQTTVVKNALNRVRNASCVAPKKKAFAPVCSSSRPVVAPPGPCSQFTVLNISDVATFVSKTWELKAGAQIGPCEILAISPELDDVLQTLDFTNNGVLLITGVLRIYPGASLLNNGRVFVYNGGEIGTKVSGGIILNSGSISLGNGSCGTGTISPNISYFGNPTNNQCP